MLQKHINHTISSFLDAYMTRRNLEDTLALLSEHASWIGCGNNEKAFGHEQVKRMLHTDMTTMPNPINWKMTEYHEQVAGPGILDIFFVLQLTDPTQEHQLSDMRVSCSCITTNGTTTIHSIHASVATDLQHSTIFFPLSRSEITLQNTLLDSQKELNTLMETVQAGIAVLKYQEGTLIPLYFNQGLCNLMHSTAEEINEIYLTDAFRGVHPDDVQRVKNAFASSVQNLTRMVETYRLRNHAGEYSLVNVNAIPTPRADGSLYYYVVYTDITTERKLLEEARIREQAINIAVEQTGINIWVLDIRDHVITQTESSRMLSKISQGGILRDVPRSLFESGYIVTEDIPIMNRMYDDIFGGVAHSECTVRWKTDDAGGFIWLRTFYTTVYDESGIPIQAIGSALDVTEQIQMQQKYHEFEAYQYLMLSESVAAFKVNVTRDTIEDAIHLDDGISQLSQATSLTQFSQLSANNIVDEELKIQYEQMFSCQNMLHSFAVGQTHLEMECPYRFGSDTYRWIRIVRNLMKNPSTGDIIGFTYAVDIHDEKMLGAVVEHMLQHDFDRVICIDVPTKKFRILEHLDDGAAAFTQDYNNYDDTLSMQAKPFIHPDDWETYTEGIKLSTIEAHLSQQDAYELTIRGFLPSGEMRFKKYMFSYLDDNHTTILFSRSDITHTVQEQGKMNQQLKDALAEAKRANAAKSEFLSRMSHDMRTPMNGIMGLTRLAMELPHATLEMAEYLHGIKSSSRYLMSLINDVLDMSKIESNKLMLMPQTFKAQELVDDITLAIRNMAKEKHIALNLQLVKTDLGYISADRVRLQQIFVNILSNAIKFSHEWGEIDWMIQRLSAEGDILHTKITIRDNGIGMSKEFLPKLFDPFEQEHIDVGTEYVGTGLGMPIVQQLVHAMGGTIEVSSEQGVGTQVVIYMDFKQVPDPTAVQEPSKLDWSGMQGKHVLICEDHPINMQISCKMLEKQGVVVAQARNGQEGLVRFEESAPYAFDAVLMDIRMPVMDGIETTRAIRSLNRPDAQTVPIVAMTANAYESDRQQALQAGMNAHLAKPIEPELLYKTLASFWFPGETP